MMIAQRLYEGIELGRRRHRRPHHLHAYRLDPVSNDALGRGARVDRQRLRQGISAGVAQHLSSRRKAAQEAHEAIRPTSVDASSGQIKQYLQEDEYKVYKLIWQRFVASQMNPAIFDQTTVDIDANTAARPLSLPRDRVGAEVRRLPEGLRGVEGQQGRRRRGAQAQAAGAGRGPEAHAEGT